MKKSIDSIVRYILLTLIIGITAYFIIRHRKVLTNLDVLSIRTYILSYGKFAALIFIVLYALKPIVFIVPASLLSILAGNIFGSYKALILSMISCFLAGTVGFYLARFLGKSFVDRLLKGKALKLDSSIERHGFKIMLAMRLSVVFPYDALSYAAGLTKMKYWDFILGTLIGVLPEMTTYSFMGNNLYEPLSARFFIPIIITAIIAVFSYYSIKSDKKRNLLNK